MILCNATIIFPSYRQPIDNLTPEERDARTVFCMQLAARIRPRDLEEFFSAVGKVCSSTVFSEPVPSHFNNFVLYCCDTGFII